MLSAEVHGLLVKLMFVLAGLTFLILWFVPAPYGRHRREGWGPTLPNRMGWVFMESPAVFGFAVIYAAGVRAWETVSLVFFWLWQLHYVHRTLVYPFRLRGNHRLPVVVAVMAFGFNILNALVNAGWISSLGTYATAWLGDPRFVLGVLIFFTGWVINLHADHILIKLRSQDAKGYRVPRGGLYRWVSCPNYLGEILEWLGWALATWSLAGMAFAVYTMANLVPRAITHHRWYQSHFENYPSQRKALVPYLF